MKIMEVLLFVAIGDRDRGYSNELSTRRQFVGSRVLVIILNVAVKNKLPSYEKAFKNNEVGRS
jgi:hypothetical protein